MLTQMHMLKNINLAYSIAYNNSKIILFCRICVRTPYINIKDVSITFSACIYLCVSDHNQRNNQD